MEERGEKLLHICKAFFITLSLYGSHLDNVIISIRQPFLFGGHLPVTDILMWRPFGLSGNHDLAATTAIFICNPF
jgi:hypothetical protein